MGVVVSWYYVDFGGVGEKIGFQSIKFFSRWVFVVAVGRSEVPGFIVAQDYLSGALAMLDEVGDIGVFDFFIFVAAPEDEKSSAVVACGVLSFFGRDNVRIVAHLPGPGFSSVGFPFEHMSFSDNEDVRLVGLDPVRDSDKVRGGGRFDSSRVSVKANGDVEAVRVTGSEDIVNVVRDIRGRIEGVRGWEGGGCVRGVGGAHRFCPHGICPSDETSQH